MNRIDAAQEQYEEQFRHTDIDRQDYIRERVLYHLAHPEVKDLDVLVMEDEHLSKFICSYYMSKTENGQREAIIVFLKAIEKIAVQIARDEANG